MKKLKLEIEALAVESFGIPQEMDARGTVRGHATFTDPRFCSTECTAVSCLSLNYGYSCGPTYCGGAECDTYQTCP